MKRLFLVPIAAGLIVSCAQKTDDAESDTEVTNALTSAVSTVTEAANEITNLSPSSASLESSFALETRTSASATAFSSLWTTSNSSIIDERDNSQTSPKEWMGVQLSEDAKRTNGSSISMFGRLKDGLDIFCAIGVGIGSIDGGSYPENDTYSITLSGDTKSGIESQCGMEIDSEMEGATVSFLVEDTSDTTYYDKKITITLPGPSSQIYYIRSNDTSVNVATSEVNDNGMHRTVVAYDVASKVMKLEYISGPDAALSNGEHVSAYRLFFDETNDQGYMLTLEHNEDTTDQVTKYILAGKPQADSAEFSLSFFSDAIHASNIYEACVSAQDGSITGTDGTYCSDSSNSLAGISLASSNVWDSFITNWDNSVYNSVSESTTISFTSSTVHDADFSEN